MTDGSAAELSAAGAKPGSTERGSPREAGSGEVTAT
jgi:hypothetical protein